MFTKNTKLLVGLISLLPERKIVGRTRLQKSLYLLQKTGFPTDYKYSIYFYGPFSEEVQTDLKLLSETEKIREIEDYSEHSNRTFYSYEVEKDFSNEIDFDTVKNYQSQIKKLYAEQDVILELAATFDKFRELGFDNQKSLEILKRKKSSKCSQDNSRNMFKLLKDLELIKEEDIPNC